MKPSRISKKGIQTMTFEQNMHDYKTAIEEALKNMVYLNFYSNSFQQKLIDSMNYSIHAGGKRIRPILLLESNKILGGSHERAMPFACALELIHTYSLIHDDLPAMDDDDLRRGKPTNHTVYGEALAILSGDALLNLAYEIMLESIEDRQGIDAARILAESSGSRGMVGGQSVDVLSEGLSIEKDILEYIHINKTSRLIEAALKMGAALAGGSKEEIAALSCFGFHLGMAFQIKDDLLDIEGNESLLGKPVGSDTAVKKNTFPKIIGIPASKAALEDHTRIAVSELEKIDGDTVFLKTLASYLLSRNS